MAKFSNVSKKRLVECQIDLQVIFNEVIKHFDCTIICGHRNSKAQFKAYNEGFSKLQYPDSCHNKIPAIAVDVIPYPINWKNINRMRLFAGYVLGIVSQLKAAGKISHNIRWGGDWDRDTIMKDQRFNDNPHFELFKND